MKKTKIVITIGPSSDKKSILLQLIKSGIDVARLNLSHGDQETHKEYIRLLRNIDSTIPIIVDLKGSEIRVKGLKKPLSIKKNDILKISGNKVKNTIPVSYKNIHNAVKKGSLILLDDGLIKLRVIKIIKELVYCKALNTNTLKDNKKITIPGAKLSIYVPTEQDKKGIEFAIENNIEFIALSFLKTKNEVVRAKKLVKNSKIKIISKIETVEAVKNFDEILKSSDGIMIARGDLGVELPPEEVPYIQKQIIKKCNNAGKPVITATQMLESMINNPLPTRAEISDVANAILDGTDAVMLSGESAIGKFPVDAIRIMSRIANKVENMIVHNIKIKHISVSENISHAVNELAKRLGDKIIVTTVTGFTAQMIARFKPVKPIIAVTHDETVRNQLMLSWGIKPIVFSKKIKHGHNAVYESVRECFKNKIVTRNDRLIITGGISTGEVSHTNLIEVHLVSDFVER